MSETPLPPVAPVEESVPKDKDETQDEAESITNEECNRMGPDNSDCQKNEETDLQVDEKLESDPYAYLDRNGFTSEKFKIELRNLPKHYGMRELKKLLNTKLQLESNKVKVPRKGSIWAYVCFRSEEDRNKAIETLNGYKWKGNVLKAENAKAVPDPLVKKRLQDADSIQDCKKFKNDPKLESETIKNSTTPLWEMPYNEQLEKKEKFIRDALMKFGELLLKANPELKDWFSKQAEKYDGLPCELLPIRHGELLTDGYRNKCEFSIGINEITGEKTIGFRVGSYAHGSVSVAPVDEIPSVPSKMKEAVSAFQKFVRNSKYEVYKPETHKGLWVQLTARYGFKTDQLMLIIAFKKDELTDSEVEELKNDIKTFFTEGEGKICKVTSLFIQYMDRRRTKADNGNSAFEHLLGETYIQEILLNRTFRISPQAFFQINTNATEVLYSSIAEMSGLTTDDTLLDVCCGTGSIGICLSDRCAQVLGLEKSAEAIADAKENATANKVENAEFFAGTAEEILSSVAHRSTQKKIVAIVDPPRAGLHHKALVQLRKTKQINKLVYVACNPMLAVNNYVDLGRACSKAYQRNPFLPVRAVAVDLFPFTNHCELLIYFERTPDES